MFWLAVVLVLGLVVLGLYWLSDHIGGRVVIAAVGAFIALAVAGVVLFVHVNSGGNGSRVPSPVATAASTTTTATTTAPTTAPAARPPQQIRVEVVNAARVPKAAATKADALKALGYVVVGTGNATTQHGSTAACKAGFDREAAKLAQDAGPGTAVAAFPNSPPKGSTDADCVVVLGQ